MSSYRLVGLVVKASASRAVDLGSIPAFPLGDFSGSNDACNLNSGTPVAALPGVWLAPCLCTVNGWDSKFDLQCLFQCASTLRLSEHICP